MDDLEKKFILQFDDMPGVRLNAFEAWCEHRKTAGLSFRDFIVDYESAMQQAAKAEELKNKLAEYIVANEASAERDTKQKREIAELKAALWVKTNWKMVGAAAAALIMVVSGGWAYERYWSRSDAVNAGLRAVVASAQWGQGWSEPVARTIGGEPYWLMFRGDIDAASYSDSRGRPIEMRCLHLYATPAQPYSGQYVKPSPRNFLGSVNWPELAMQCRPSPTTQEANSK